MLSVPKAHALNQSSSSVSSSKRLWLSTNPQKEYTCSTWSKRFLKFSFRYVSTRVMIPSNLILSFSNCLFSWKKRKLCPYRHAHFTHRNAVICCPLHYLCSNDLQWKALYFFHFRSYLFRMLHLCAWFFL